MKKFLLSILACGAVAGAIAGITAVGKYEKTKATQQTAYRADLDAAQQKADVERVMNARRSAVRVPEFEWAGTDTVGYFVVARSATEGYLYTHEGGDINTYDFGVCRDGDKVWLTGIGNAYDPTSWSIVHEYPVEGTYDAAAGTITIASPYADAAVSGYGDHYELIAGTFDEGGNLEADETFVLDVTGDLDKLSTHQDFGLRYEYSWSSGSYGWGVRYHHIDAYKKDASMPANLVRFEESVDFGDTYPGMPVTKTWRVINVGGQEAEYVIKIDADDDAYTCDEMSGVIAPYTAKDITFTFNPQEVGEFEGLATISTEDGDPVLVQFAGNCVAIPDYSAIVKNGDFTFETGIDFPFEIAQFNHPVSDTETEDITVAKSSTNGAYGVSFLKAKFNVPEGKMGKLSFKGHMINSGGAASWYKVASSILVDDDNTYVAQYNYTGDYAAEHTYFELKPGDHYLYIYHNNSYYTGMAQDGTYIWDLDLQLEDVIDDAADLLTPSINLGNSMLTEGGVATKEGVIVLTNKGANPLEVTEAVSDNSEIKVMLPGLTAGTLENLQVPVRLEATTLGEKTANISLTTNAGKFDIVVKANVIARPDYTQIVSGDTQILSFGYNEEYPFIIENGKAFNCTSKVEDTEPTRSSFIINYEVPEGKIAEFTWDAHSWGTPVEQYGSVSAYDYGSLTISNPAGYSYTGGYYDNDVDAGSDALVANGMDQYLVSKAGTGYFEFGYNQGGDSNYYGEDRMEMSNFNVKLSDAAEDAVELLTPEVEFAPVYVGPGRYSEAKIKLRNMGTNLLTVLEIPNSGCFYGIVPENVYEYENGFYRVQEVTLWFYPTEEGEFEDDLTIKTSAGDVKVHCKASTKSSEGIVYPGDFEDNAYGWVLYDLDGDGDCWNLATNLFGERPTYVHSGVQSLVSVSQHMSMGALTPDNLTVSPGITIPEDGAKLTYYVASFSPDAYQEHYSFYIAEDFDGSDATQITSLTPVIEETINEPATQEQTNGYVDGWMMREVDLTPYAGKTIYFAFRHHDCTGQYILRLDDMFINMVDGVNMVDGSFSHGIVRQEIFDANGLRHSELQNGVNIVRTYYDNGKSSVSKVVYRKK